MSELFVPFKELTLANDFIFGEVMRQERFCIPFLEALIQKKISRVVAIDKQKDLKDVVEAHGIRLDVYLEDSSGTKYDIEMQAIAQPDLERRIRYYQSGIDRTALKPSESYSEMRESYVIFVCTFDYYKRGLAVYERESHLKGTDIPYIDGTHAYILNSSFTDGNASPELIGFLRYLDAVSHGRTVDTTSSQLIADIDREVTAIKTDERKEKDYMTLTMKLQDTRRDALEEGRKEGRKEGRSEERFHLLKAMAKKGLGVVEIAELTGLSKAIIEETLKKANEDAQ